MSRQWWTLLAIALLVSAITARLGFWQLSRAQAKTDVHALQMERQQQPALTNADWVKPAPAEEWLQRRVHVQGHWLPQFTVYLDNRSLGAQSGFYVLTPLQLAQGPVLWVQRGWMARDRVRSDLLPPLPHPEGQIDLHGRVIPPPSKLMELGSPVQKEEGFATLRHNVDFEQFRAQTGLDIVATVLQTEGAPDGLSRQWPEPGSGADKNRGYAFQWFALSLLSLLLFAWFQIWKKRPHDCPSTPE